VIRIGPYSKKCTTQHLGTVRNRACFLDCGTFRFRCSECSHVSCISKCSLLSYPRVPVSWMWSHLGPSQRDTRPRVLDASFENRRRRPNFRRSHGSHRKDSIQRDLCFLGERSRLQDLLGFDIRAARYTRQGQAFQTTVSAQPIRENRTVNFTTFKRGRASGPDSARGPPPK
jgi:hypothetical protein